MFCLIIELDSEKEKEREREERKKNLWPFVSSWRDEYHLLTVTQHFSSLKGIVETKSKQTNSRWRRESSFLDGVEIL
jgi:hypothetical protein